MGADRIIGVQIKEARLKAGISQEKLGIAAGIEEASAGVRINQYERFKHLPGPVIVSRIAEALKLPVSYFYEPDDDIAGTIVLFAGLSKQERRKALLTLRSLERT